MWIWSLHLKLSPEVVQGIGIMVQWTPNYTGGGKVGDRLFTRYHFSPFQFWTVRIDYLYPKTKQKKTKLFPASYISFLWNIPQTNHPVSAAAFPAQEIYLPTEGDGPSIISQHCWTVLFISRWNPSSCGIVPLAWTPVPGKQHRVVVSTCADETGVQTPPLQLISSRVFHLSEPQFLHLLWGEA